MRALTFQGKNQVSVETVPDPKIEHPRDAVPGVCASANMSDAERLIFKRNAASAC